MLTSDVKVTVVLEVRASYVAVQTDVAIDKRVESNRFRVGDVFHSEHADNVHKHRSDSVLSLQCILTRSVLLHHCNI